MAGLTDGKYVLKLNPPEGHELRGALPGPVTDKAVRNAQLRPVGPGDDFPKDPPGHTRFRFLEIEITLVRGGVKDGECRLGKGMLHQDDVPEQSAVAAHGAVARESQTRLLIDWRPDWVRCAFADERKQLQVDPRQTPESDPKRPKKHLSGVQFIILHHTDADTPGSTINHFCDVVNNRSKTAAHYLVDVDGHVIKLANESASVRHAGECYWYGLDSYEGSAMQTAGFNWNDISVGIEQVHKGTDTYASTLVAGTKNLIERIRSVHGTSPHNVLGHGEVNLHKDQLIRGRRIKIKNLGRKLFCPGEVYDWHILENSGNATKPLLKAGVVPHERYGHFFVRFPGESINTVKDDKKIVPAAITGLQMTLRELGYFVNVTAAYDEPTARAVEAFQVRYFSGRLRETERARSRKGRIRLANLLTIERMHQVLMARNGFTY
jgi:N-acetyl-anhydromuramyl-L-alanine amidase AmpD